MTLTTKQCKHEGEGLWKRKKKMMRRRRRSRKKMKGESTASGGGADALRNAEAVAERIEEAVGAAGTARLSRALTLNGSLHPESIISKQS